MKPVNLKSAQDANQDLALNISKNHVLGAVCKDPQKCVIANAGRGVPKLTDVWATASYVYLEIAGDWFRYRTSSVLRDALLRFDETGDWKLKPGQYLLRAISRSKTREYQCAKNRRLNARKRAGLGPVRIQKAPRINPRHVAVLAARRMEVA